LASVFAALAAVFSLAHAQTAGIRPLRIVVPATPAGGIDANARVLAAELSAVLAQTVIVDNRPGGSGNIGADYVAKSAPDGRTVLLTTNTYTINAAVSKSLPFDPLTDLAPISMLGTAPLVFAANANVPVLDLAQLVALSRNKDSQLSYASCATGGVQHLAGELFKSMTGADIIHIPYKGCAPAIMDVAGGQVSLAIVPISTAMPHVQSGKVRALALTTKKRTALAPEVPSAEEAGLSGYHVDTWYGLFVAGKTPRDVVERVNATMVRTLGREELVKKLLAQGVEPAPGSADDFGRVVRSDIERWRKLARELKLELD
jgi:tripartite-type tricarboxylate transporter receptor subunit TctC